MSWNISLLLIFFFFANPLKMWKLFSWVVQKQVVCEIWPTDGSLLIPDLNGEGRGFLCPGLDGGSRLWMPAQHAQVWSRRGSGRQCRAASSPGVGHYRWRAGRGGGMTGMIGFLVWLVFWKEIHFYLKKFSGFSWVVGNLSMLKMGHFFLKEHSSSLTRS